MPGVGGNLKTVVTKTKKTTYFIVYILSLNMHFESGYKHRLYNSDG